MKFRSRISVILFVVIFNALFYPLIVDGKDIFAKNITVGVVYILIMIICLLAFVTINYTISGSSLITRLSGVKMSTIDIASIKSVKRSYIIVSSPAASLKRLEIKFYSNGSHESAIISPARETEFLEKLKEINPNIEIRVKQSRNILRFWDWDI